MKRVGSECLHFNGDIQRQNIRVQILMDQTVADQMSRKKSPQKRRQSKNFEIKFQLMLFLVMKRSLFGSVISSNHITAHWSLFQLAATHTHTHSYCTKYSLLLQTETNPPQKIVPSCFSSLSKVW